MSFCVVGSLNIDIIVRTQKFPDPGETVSGRTMDTLLGGKGGNQAVALSKLSDSLSFIGKVGDDSYGENYFNVLCDNGIDTTGVKYAETSTGAAVIEVEEATSQNRIVIVSGANEQVDVDWVRENSKIIEKSDILLLQLEIPISSVVQSAQIMKESGGVVILDPAPSRDLPEELYGCVDYITPNESEVEQLTGVRCDCQENVIKAASILQRRGIPHVVVKLGKKGACYLAGEHLISSLPYDVPTVDTTGAGDSFNAGLAFAVKEKMPPKEMMDFANAVGSIATTTRGGQGGMLSLQNVQTIMEKNLRLNS